MAPRKSIARAMVLATLLAAPAAGKTLRTITIDGDMADWTEVLLDRDQKVADRSQAQGDPDNPSQAQRDERGVAFTWDAANLYFYFSRTGAGTNSFNGLFYFDFGHDRLLSSADSLAFFKFTGSNFGGFELDRYDDGGTPDAIGGDGVSPAGSAGAQVTTAGGNAAVDANGIAMEASIAWATLGVPAGTPMFIHPALTSNTNLPAGIQDNTDLLDTFLVDVGLSPGTTKGTAPGRFVDFPHRVTNDGTAPEIIDLIFRTRLGFSVGVWSDPDGDGDPSDGVLLELDTNGDGDTTDAGDIPPIPAADTNGNSFVDGGALAAGASRAWVVRVGVPARQALGSIEAVHVFAVSSYRPSVRDETDDVVIVGRLTLSPPRSLASGPGQVMRLSHVACNHSGVARPLDVAFTSSQGWSGSLVSDPDGDGDPSDGAPLADSDGSGLPDLGLVADGACAAFVLVLSVPSGAVPGTVDDIDVAILAGADTASLADVIEIVAGRVDVRPDRAARSQRGKTIYLQHEVRSGSSESDSLVLTVASTLGSQVAALDDPNDDGDPDVSVVVTSTGPLPGNGGRFPMISRIRIPPTAVHGNVDRVTTEAESLAHLDFDTAIDTISVVGLLTYSDALFARPTSEFFGQCSTMYALAYRSGGGTYRFLWIDPVGITRRTSPDILPYSDGSLDDFLDAGAAPMFGTWTVKLQARSGSSYIDVGAAGTTTFQVLDLIGAGTRISLNDAGADIYQLAGEPLSGFADLDNPSSVDIVGSRIDHVAFFDADGSDAPTAGEDYVRPDGTIGAWAAGLATAQRTGLDVFARERSGDRFVTAAVAYSRSGVWTLESRWTASCGVLLSTRVATFTVGCQPPPAFDGLADVQDVDPCASTGLLLSWSPATSWGLGTDGTYAVYRSTDPGFTPDPSTLLAWGVTGLSYLDASAAPDTMYSYVVRAESNVTCSDGPNNAGLLDANFVHVEAIDADAGEVPIATFAQVSPACAGAAAVDFADTSTGPPATWAWDFDGDGAPDADTATPSWSFPSAGDWPVTLIVTNVCGSDSGTQIITVTMPPTAAIGASRPATCVGETVDLEGLASSAAPPAAITSWSWDFDGDGFEDSSSADPAPIGWPLPGMHRVTLTVVDSIGCTATDAIDVEVFEMLQLTLGMPVVDPCTGFTSIRATATGGDGAYAFVFSDLVDDGTGLGEGGLPSGPHAETVTVTDGAGCTAQAVANFDVATSVGGSFASTVAYIYPDQFQADLLATGGGGVGPYTFTWDIGADGSIEGSGPAISFGLSANETVPVEMIVTDANGCTALVRQDVVSGGCPVDTPLALLMVRKQGAGFAFSWQASTHPCHGRYELLEAAAARPSGSRSGTWPTDPAWASLTADDADGTDLDAGFVLAEPRSGLTRFYLVRDGGTDGSFGPVESYGG